MPSFLPRPIISECMFKAAYFGLPGAYSEQASIKYFGSSIGLKECGFLTEVFESVGVDSEFGVVPIENSIEGAVTQTYDLLLGSELSIVGEVIVGISHCLMAVKGVNLVQVKDVYSHPQALGQCRAFLEAHKLNSIPFYDTAGSAKMLKEKVLRNAAAIASARAAKVYGMNVLADGIQSNRHNYTRFLIISNGSSAHSPDKTTIAFSAKDKPGSLFRALNAFADNKVNLLYIQSRPIPGAPWEYNFYVDCNGSINDKRVRRAIATLYDNSDFVKVLGSYKRARFDKNV